jgi:flagellar protein FliS
MGISQELAAYREMEVETKSPMELVIMLCDALVRDLKQVIVAIRAQDVQERVNQSNHAFQVLRELDLMLDFQNGGTTAKELAGVYSYVRGKLIESQIKLDPAILERQIEFMMQVRDAWQQSVTTMKQSAVAKVEVPAFVPESGPYANTGEPVQSCGWSA